VAAYEASPLKEYGDLLHLMQWLFDLADQAHQSAQKSSTF